MIKLLKFELHKLIRSKSPYIFLAIQFVSILIVVATSKLFRAENAEIMGLAASANGFALKALSLGLTATLLAVFVALFVCGDRNDDVLKNIYARGYTPTEVMFAEYITVMIYTVIFCVFSWLSGFVLGISMFPLGSGKGGRIFALLVFQLINLSAFSALFFMFSKLINKMAGVIALNILVPEIVELVLSVTDIALAEKNIQTIKYWMSGLLLTLSETTSTDRNIAIAVVLSAVYCAVFTVIAYLANRRRSA